MRAPPPHTHISTGRTNSELNRVAPGSTSATTGAISTSVSAGRTRFQSRAAAPSTVDMSAPQGVALPGKVFVRDLGIFARPARSGGGNAGRVGRRANGGLLVAAGQETTLRPSNKTSD